jgi:glycosyltransferase involved in cell wall biosynthesis
MNNVKVFITSFLHAASYTKEDAFSVAAYYQKYTEVGWIACSDLVFVGSQYHKQQVIRERLRPYGAKNLESNLYVSKNPLFLSDYPRANNTNLLAGKQKKVLLTNRFDTEKRPNETLEMFAILKLRYPDWEFVVTTGRSTFRGTESVVYARKLEAEGVITIKAGLTKDQYHKELEEAAIMVTHSIEENYGYCLAEALIHKCHVVARKGLSHDEFLPMQFLFDNEKVRDFDVTSDLMATFNTSDWPTVNEVDTNGAENIARSLERLVL